MSVIASFTSNASITTSSFPESIYEKLRICLLSSFGSFAFYAFTFTSILVLLPPVILVLHLGLRQRLQQHLSTPTGHSDLFTFHVILHDLLSIFGCVVMSCGIHIHIPYMILVGMYFYSTNLLGQMFFHILICMDRYVAVVYPVTYLSLKTTKWIRIRNITITCVWLCSWCFFTHFIYQNGSSFAYLLIGAETIAIFLIFAINLYIVLSLICRHPGKEGGCRHVDPLKVKALQNVTVILGVLSLRFLGHILATATTVIDQIQEAEKCITYLTGIWLTLPSSLVLPLIYLQRAGKLLF